MMGYNSTIRIDELFMKSSSCMNFKIIMTSERQTKQEYILYNSMYIKFQKNASDLQWPKQIQWSPGTSRGWRWEGGPHRTWRNLGDDVCIQYLDCGDGFTGAYLCQNLTNCRLKYV